MKQRIRFLLDRVRDEFSQQRREFEAMPAISRRDDKTGPFRIGRDPKIAIVSVAIKTNARVHNWRGSQRGECLR